MKTKKLCGKLGSGLDCEKLVWGFALLRQAAQTPSSSQFATTSLTVSIQVKSLHKPRFQKPEYQCAVSSVGAMATDPTNKDKPLQIVALDDDYASVGVKPC